MLHSAHWLLHNETATLTRLLEENPGYNLHVIGHSLGAGGGLLKACQAVAAGSDRAPKSELLARCFQADNPKGRQIAKREFQWDERMGQSLQADGNIENVVSQGKILLIKCLMSVCYCPKNGFQGRGFWR